MNPNNIDTIIFDFGGVLIDWNPRYLLKKILGDNPIAIENFLNEINFHKWNTDFDRGLDSATGITAWCKKYPQHADLIRLYDQRWQETIGGAISGTVSILHQLKAGGHSLLGLSNWSKEKFALTRPKHDFFTCFEMILISGEEKLIKPDARFFNLLLSRSGKVPAQCLFIDDVLENVKAATALGMKTIQFQSPEKLQDELSLLKLL